MEILDDWKPLWQDLSSLVHDQSIAYYEQISTPYLAMFHITTSKVMGSGIFQIKTSLF
jgi:hypothetical protein